MDDWEIGQHVTVRSGPPDHGSFAGVIIALNDIRMIVTPDDPALRQWFRTGYDIGKAHWGQAVIHATQGGQ